MSFLIGFAMFYIGYKIIKGDPKFKNVNVTLKSKKGTLVSPSQDFIGWLMGKENK